jgi:hypothetical protein
MKHDKVLVFFTTQAINERTRLKTIQLSTWESNPWPLTWDTESPALSWRRLTLTIIGQVPIHRNEAYDGTSHRTVLITSCTVTESLVVMLTFTMHIQFQVSLNRKVMLLTPSSSKCHNSGNQWPIIKYANTVCMHRPTCILSACLHASIAFVFATSNL